jgi:hypothetical protein
MTDASLTNVVFVAFAALTVTLYRPPRPEGGSAPPASGLPMSASAPPDVRASSSRSHAYGAPPPVRGLTVPLEPRPRRSAPDTATPWRGVILIVSQGDGACRRRRRIAAATTMSAR